MKILVIGDFTSIPLTRGCADALTLLGCEVLRFDSEDRTSAIAGTFMRLSKSLAKLIGLKSQLSTYYANRIYRRRRNALLELVLTAAPEVILVVRGNNFDADTLRHLRRQAQLVCWFIRDQKRDAAVRAELPEFDLYYSQHRSHEAIGIAHLPVFTYDPVNYFASPSVVKDVPLLFIGSWTPKRQRWLEALAELAPQLTIIGPRWRTKLGHQHVLAPSVKEKWVSGALLRNWYQRARVVININQWDESELSGANLRVTDVPACGTVLLTEYSQDLDDYFDIGKEVVVFRNPEEMVNLCRRLLADAVWRQRIESAGSVAVQRMGTYHERMTQILADLSKLPATNEKSS